MLKPDVGFGLVLGAAQPPSGGCVLKLVIGIAAVAAAFPAAFRRLCVETIKPVGRKLYEWPAAFRRLCVETLAMARIDLPLMTSRLQAAVC